MVAFRALVHVEDEVDDGDEFRLDDYPLLMSRITPLKLYEKNELKSHLI